MTLRAFPSSAFYRPLSFVYWRALRLLRPSPILQQQFRRAGREGADFVFLAGFFAGKSAFADRSAGPTISLISAEPVFLMAAALNACGYDEGLEESAPVRKWSATR